MHISAVLLARSLGFFDTNELNPNGKVYLPHLVPFIVDRFSFLHYPSKLEDFTNGDGILFKSGYFSGLTIDEIGIYGDGIKIDVRSSTDEGKALLIDALQWLSREHGITFSNRTVSRWAYVSHLSIQSDVHLDRMFKPLDNLRQNLFEKLEGDPRVLSEMHVDSIGISLDRVIESQLIAPFTIERRAKTSASSGKYFTTAPLSTRDHIQILEKFEKDVLDLVEW